MEAIIVEKAIQGLNTFHILNSVLFHATLQFEHQMWDEVSILERGNWV